MKIPLCINSDAYTISSDFFSSPKAKKKSVYNYTNRYSPKVAWPEVAKDDRMIFYGLSHFIDKHLSKPITEEDIVDSAHFMESAHSFGGMLPFNKELWYRVLREYNGFLPIKIEALEEGSVFFPNEPVIQVTSLAEGFGELCVHIEPLLVGIVSIATARATLTRHYLERMKEYAKLDGVAPDFARFMIHDFGMRASSCEEESVLLGTAHLLSFYGTDSFNAAYATRQMGALSPTGTSILASAHHSILAWDTETESFNALHEAGRKCGVNICSYVSDTYNSDKALDSLVKMAKDNPLSTFVCRIDSGDAIQNTLKIANAAKINGLCKETKNGLMPTNLKCINGDSITPELSYGILDALRDNGYVPTTWTIFGVGGYLRNNVTRDSLSSAYKLSARGNDEPVVKLSNTQSKMSVPGPNVLLRFNDRKHHEFYPSVCLTSENIEKLGAYKTYYKGKKWSNLDTFANKQDRCINDFDSFNNINPQILSKAIVEIQNKVYSQHKGL